MADELDDSSEINLDDAINSSYEEVLGDSPQPSIPEKTPIAETTEIESEVTDDPVENTAPAFVPKWRKEALEKYATLDPVIKAEIEKREQDFHKGIEVYKTGAQQAQAWDQALQPFMATIQQYGETPQSMAQQLFGVDHMLRTGTPEQKAQIVMQIAKSAGVDLANMPAQPQVPPEYSQLQQVTQSLAQRLENFERQSQEAEIQQLNSMVQEFGKTAPHFESVKGEMAALLQAGQAKTLQEAYDKAVWLNPDIRTQILAKQQADEAVKRNEVAKAAKKASVTNIAKRGHVASKASNVTSLDDAISSSMEEIGLG